MELHNEPFFFDFGDLYSIETANGTFDIPKNGVCIKGNIINIDNELKVAIQIDMIGVKILEEQINRIITNSRKKPRKLNRLYRQLKRLQKEYNNDSTRND